ncbi:Acetyltransferase (GNAT) family protein [Nakamurella panacisegetis]|uniref:Acetyltransferase (GNAT) family protein n=1 Tax=Nakamurella panacisegetis TaxID=1090615 RepID=A0A1H0RNC0_9ACTN|nr:GNAT family N-acetyltransferase [Nakamurella panacisegetis]SDP31003.1 Acetyltransferase (GNAT) family protein [Nakamurella panacisegetis]
MRPAPTVLELESIAAHGWRGTTVRRLGGWLLRSGGGFTDRANSVLPIGSPGCDLDQALGVVRSFYAEQDRPARFQLPDDEPGSPLAVLDGQLRDRGWSGYTSVAVMTAAVPDLLAACPPVPGLPAAEFSPTPTADWLDGYHYRGKPLPPNAVAVLVEADGPVFASVTDERGQAGVARGVITDGWLGVTAVTVDRARRRSGVGRHLMGELNRWAAANGAHSVYLQVDRENTAALALYDRLGFTEHHRYHYRVSP